MVKIQLLILEPGSSSTDLRLDLVTESLENCLEYEVLACMDDPKDLREVTIGSEKIQIAQDLYCALVSLATENRPRRFWTETLCRTQTQQWNEEEEMRKKEIHLKAKQVLIYIGSDHEVGDLLDGYLGKGTAISTQHAFTFAEELASAAFTAQELDKIMQQRISDSDRLKWCFLARLLYRPWFREARLLRTNYIDQLRRVIVRCGNTSVSWPVINEAARRARVIQQTPEVFGKAGLPVSDKECLPGLSFKECIMWKEARERFGFDIIRTFAQIFWLLEQEKARIQATQMDSAESLRLKCLTGLLGAMGDFRESQIGRFKKYLNEVSLKMTDPSEFSKRDLEPLMPMQSLPFDSGYWPSIPLPEHQAKFMHSEIDHSNEMRHLILLPSGGDPSKPIQCGLVHVSRETPPPFIYVQNTALKRYRQKSLILVNNQSFQISRALELVLRQIRSPAKQLRLFIWEICMDPDEVALTGRKALDHYFLVKSVTVKQDTVMVDFHSVLDKLSETTTGQLPAGLTKDDWLLDLMDEEEVIDLPEDYPLFEERKLTANEKVIQQNEELTNHSEITIMPASVPMYKIFQSS